MFEFFTDHGKQAVAASQDEAIALGHDFIGTEHILLGLLTVPEGHALKVLAALQAAPAALRETVLAQTALEGS
ncbi:Clp protease N-terminal domain-containing protein [Streptomyces sp. NPDC056004]|uniref:Clp protease N-terminal domain-containing protein n=1 Tax=Streptomyces sp. NPDC056004 TaxID=3345677 RepID=UPI0035DE4D3E